jgi:hypothetical protein
VTWFQTLLSVLFFLLFLFFSFVTILSDWRCGEGSVLLTFCLFFLLLLFGVHVCYFNLEQMSGSAFLRSLLTHQRYRDRSFTGTDAEYARALSTSSTCYVGNLAFFTTEEQIYEVFSRAGGEIKRIIMGLDRNTHNPCGFCFVEFYDAADARLAEYLVKDGLILIDERACKVDADHGFAEGRQFGRGLQGGQVKKKNLGGFLISNQ